MTAARRKKPVRKASGTPSWMWLMSGVLIGLGLAYDLWSKGYIPQPQAETATTEEAAIVHPEASWKSFKTISIITIAIKKPPCCSF